MHRVENQSARGGSLDMNRGMHRIRHRLSRCRLGLLGANIAVLGAAFKPDSDDVRDSPALNVAGMLQLNGATVDVYDPKAMEHSQRVFSTLKLCGIGIGSL